MLRKRTNKTTKKVWLTLLIKSLQIKFENCRAKCSKHSAQTKETRFGGLEMKWERSTTEQKNERRETHIWRNHMQIIIRRVVNLQNDWVNTKPFQHHVNKWKRTQDCKCGRDACFEEGTFPSTWKIAKIIDKESSYIVGLLHGNH